MDSQQQGRAKKPLTRPYLWLLALPFIWQVALVPVVNDVNFQPFNIPFPMLWQMLGIVLTSAVIAVVFLLDKNAGLEEEEAEFLSLTLRSDAGRAQK